MPEVGSVDQRRGVSDALDRALTRHAVVLLVGPPGVGKSAVAQRAFPDAPIVERVALASDPDARRAAAADPGAFLRKLGVPAVVDDVHLVPALLVELESLAERLRTPGSLLAVAGTDGLRIAARAVGVRRIPHVSVGSLTQGEQLQRVGRLITAALTGDPSQWPFEALSTADYVERALAGGLPAPLALGEPAARAVAYRRTVGERLAGLPPAEAQGCARVLHHVLAGTSGRITVDQDGRELGLSSGAFQAGLDALEALGLVRLSPAWTRFRRGADVLRAYAHDPGFLNAAAPGGPSAIPALAALRTLVAHELHTQNAWSRHPVEISFWRAKPAQFDIDFLLEERGGGVVPVAVSAAANPGVDEFAGIDAFRRRHPRAYRRGILLHPGERIRSLADNRWAVPLSVLWTVSDGEAPLDVASLDAELEAAASALRVLVERPSVSDPELAGRRVEIGEIMECSIGPRLERIALVLGSLGLGVDRVGPVAHPPADPPAPGPPARPPAVTAPPSWLSGVLAALRRSTQDARLVVIKGLEIRTPDADPAAAARWVAFVSAAVMAGGSVSWQAGHALLPPPVLGVDGPDADDGARLVGMAGPVFGPAGGAVDEGALDQLCAALAATLPDAMAALQPTG